MRCDMCPMYCQEENISIIITHAARSMQHACSHARACVHTHTQHARTHARVRIQICMHVRTKMHERTHVHADTHSRTHALEHVDCNVLYGSATHRDVHVCVCIRVWCMSFTCVGVFMRMRTCMCVRVLVRKTHGFKDTQRHRRTDTHRHVLVFCSCARPYVRATYLSTHKPSYSAITTDSSLPCCTAPSLHPPSPTLSLFL